MRTILKFRKPGAKRRGLPYIEMPPESCHCSGGQEACEAVRNILICLDGVCKPICESMSPPGGQGKSASAHSLPNRAEP